MGAKLPESERKIRVPPREQEVAIVTVSAGETWSLSAAGVWSTGAANAETIEAVVRKLER